MSWIYLGTDQCVYVRQTCDMGGTSGIRDCFTDHNQVVSAFCDLFLII